MSHPETNALTVRLFHESDIGFALAQTTREGWDCTAATFALHLAHDGDGCFIAEVDGKKAGMVTTTRYRRTGWIGNLIVPPERRGLGIGSRLMEHAIRHLEHAGIATIRLEADPMGINIYRKLGFADEFDSPRFRREPGSTPGARSAVPLPDADLGVVAAFDEQNFGDDRTGLLRLLHAGAFASWRAPESRRLGGYLMVQPAQAGARLGPWVASDVGVAGVLLDAALGSFGNRAMILAVPGPNLACRELLASRGFFETPSSLRMVRGPDVGRGRPENVYALANGAAG
jgi:ribosomal protein S18 acetylase RimI-like enzyme